jgi:hypothetical protein
MDPTMPARRHLSQPIPPLSEPIEVHVIADEVVFIGQGRAGFSMTRSAALETSRRLAVLFDQAAH